MKLVTKLLAAALLTLPLAGMAAETPAFRNTALPIAERVNDLVSRMTLQEKISQMTHVSAPIERLGIPAYNWWNECLHGVGRSGDKVTVFPQAIGMAATFDPEAMLRTAEIISDEARAIYNQELNTKGSTGQYKGLTFWTPNINIFRDPRWGRGQETYGEDPYLTARMGSSMVRGLQGDNPDYLKSSACAKHFAVHSGPEHNRHSFNATATAHDLWDTYLPAFRTLVRDADVSSVMCAYNRLDGQPCCANDQLMRQILLYEWEFKGYVTSDCWGVNDFYKYHKTHPDAASSVADAVLHGTDLECGNDYPSLIKALERGLITQEQIDVSVRRLMNIRMRLGMLDPASEVPYSDIPYSVLESSAHQAQALLMARESMVMLRNNRSTLPLSSKKIRRIALLGPNADNGETQLGNYNGFPTNNITILKALQAMPDVEVIYDPATDFASELKDGSSVEDIISKIKGVDLVIFAGGISPRLEGEAGDAGNDNVNGFAGGDRSRIELPEVQTALMKRIKESVKAPLVFVSMSGSAIAFPWEAENADAIIQAWYGGQATGTAVTDVIFGRYNPSGRLPVTFYRSTNDLPDFEDYNMAGRTYRYFDGNVLYPFGYGLSFNDYRYSNLTLPATAAVGDSVTVSVTVENRGKMAGDEVVQLYTSHRATADYSPLCAMKGLQRVSLKPGERKVVKITLSPEELGFVDADGNWAERAGKVQIWVGGRSPHAPAATFGNNVVEGTMELRGETLNFKR